MYKGLKAKCPVSDDLSDTLLSLPMHPYLTGEEVSYVCDNIKEWFNRRKK
jgi:dTDP-4-amino-4,6-dideoxygalactose transaminase